ncbi:MAG: hydantoinase B/oxoprolinase family protein, partial [Nitrososphaeria archaeon]|nr:hydantoinase B/oxoprolinase family protein [Nitrososphaeria archaeon]
PPFLRATLKKYPVDRIERGDIFISNDTYNGGQHLPDIQLSLPIFYGDEVAAFACSIAHHQDVGGIYGG